MAVARMLPPTGATTPAQRPFCNGLPEVSFASSREMMVLAPSRVRNSLSSVFPVAATTLKPSLERIPTATLPTPAGPPRNENLPGILCGPERHQAQDAQSRRQPPRAITHALLQC